MKKVFVILAVMAMTGCSNMHMPWQSSSGSTSSSGMSSSGMSSSMVGTTAMPGTDAYNDNSRGTYNPASGLPVPAGP